MLFRTNLTFRNLEGVYASKRIHVRAILDLPEMITS